MNAHSPNITSLIANAEAARGIDRGAEAFAELNRLAVADALNVLERYANTLSWSHGYDRIHDGIEEIRSDLADEAGI